MTFETKATKIEELFPKLNILESCTYKLEVLAFGISELYRCEDEDEDKDENEDQGQLLLIVRVLKSVTVMLQSTSSSRPS